MPTELERTFLVKKLPEDLEKCESRELIDIYLPKSRDHPILRIRKQGDVFEITKKSPVKEGDASIQMEQTIELDEGEFNSLKNLDGKVTEKVRYYYRYNNKIIEIDVFKGGLKGLVLADIEFSSEEEKDNFVPPEFCHIEVTQEKFLAGGMLCGKSYRDIEEDLNRLNYQEL